MRRRIALVICGAGAMAASAALLLMWSEPVVALHFDRLVAIAGFAVVLLSLLGGFIALSASGGHTDLDRQRRGIRSLVVASAIVVLLLTCWVFDLPLRIRFSISREAFESAVNVTGGGNEEISVEYPRWIGAYRVTRTEEGMGEHGTRYAYFYVREDDLMGSEGLLYSKMPLPWKCVAGDWYVVRVDP